MYISDNDKLFTSKIDDGIELCLTRHKPYFFSFMSEREQVIAEQQLKTAYFENYLFFGGYNQAERKVLGLFYDEPNEACFPISGILFNFRKCDKLSHRDFLGALMSLGIEREAVGDILVEDGRCVSFVKTELKDYVISQISKVGRIGVKTYELKSQNLPEGRGTEELSYIVTSLRLDNVVAAITGLSREKTKNLILSGNVSTDYVITQNISLNLKENTILSIRGKGKFILNGVLGETKKGRIRISVIHYR